MSPRIRDGQLSARNRKRLERLRELVRLHRDKPTERTERFILSCFEHLPYMVQEQILARMYLWPPTAAMEEMGTVWRKMGYLWQNARETRRSRLTKRLPGGEWECSSCGAPMRTIRLIEQDPICIPCIRGLKAPGRYFNMQKSNVRLFKEKY
jgi:hypothetical protein